jgi:hypothetical protein
LEKKGAIKLRRKRWPTSSIFAPFIFGPCAEHLNHTRRSTAMPGSLTMYAAQQCDINQLDQLLNEYEHP